MASHPPDEMEWQPDNAELDSDFFPEDDSGCESEDYFRELDEQDARDIIRQHAGKDVQAPSLNQYRALREPARD